MRRFLISFVILGLIAGSVGAADAQTTRIQRTVRGSYSPPYVSPITGCKSLLGPWACLIIPTRANEKYFTAKVTDAHGQPVFVEVNANGATVATFCGKTARPISFRPGSHLEFHVGLLWVTPLNCPANRIKTTGTISVTLSNLP